MHQEATYTSATILTCADAPPVRVPPGYVGRVVFPRSGREVYWTGRVAIGLRWQPAANHEMGEHAELIQAVLLRKAA